MAESRTMTPQVSFSPVVFLEAGVTVACLSSEMK